MGLRVHVRDPVALSGIEPVQASLALTWPSRYTYALDHARPFFQRPRPTYLDRLTGIGPFAFARRLATEQS